MGLFSFLNHIVNFALPAFFMAVLVPTGARFVLSRPSELGGHSEWLDQAILHFALGLIILVLGLVVFGRDGKMLTYLALVGASATLQWLMDRGWRA